MCKGIVYFVEDNRGNMFTYLRRDFAEKKFWQWVNIAKRQPLSGINEIQLISKKEGRINKWNRD